MNIAEIKTFQGYYVDTDGNVYSTKKNGGFERPMSLLKLKKDKDGYLEVGMYKDKKRYFRRVHRLVAEAFIPNQNNFPYINHKDGNRSNNNVDNLEWCTNSENLKHSFSELNRKYSGNHIPIILTNKMNGDVILFYTITQCAKYLNMSHNHLGKLLSGQCDIGNWKKKDMYDVRYINNEDVTTIPHGSRDDIPEAPTPLLRGEDIVYSPNKYRETEGI